MKTKKTAITLALASLLGSPLLAAQQIKTETGEQTAGANDVDEVITVIGQKLPRTLQQTKDSVAVFTESTLEEFALVELMDVFNQTANAYEFSNGENFGIRGVTQNSAGTGGGGAGELASLYIDGVAYTGFGTRFGPKNLWDVQQVEILRGPQSTNVGRNALIGAVVVNTNRPVLEEFQAAVQLGIGNYGKQEADAMINIPLSDIAAFRLTGQFVESDGFNTNITLNDDKYDARKEHNIRGQLLIEPSDDLSMNLMVQSAKTERGQDIYLVTDNLETRESQANLSAHEDYDAIAAAFDISYNINDLWSVTGITSYINGDYDRFDDDDESAGGGNAFRGRIGKDKNWAQELRLDYDNDRLRGTAGVYYTEVDIDNNTIGLVNLAPALLGVPTQLLPFYPTLLEVDVSIPYEGTTRNAAFFTEWEYRLNNHWLLNAGLRYDYEKQKFVTNTRNALATGSELPDPVTAGQLAEQMLPGLGAQVQAGVTQVNALLNSQLQQTDNQPESTDYTAWLPQLGVTYEANEDLAVSLFYKRGYRAGGVEVNVAGRRAEFDPETLDNLELALRSQWLNDTLTFNANAYYGLWKDQQVVRCLNGSQLDCVTENSGESKIYGTELEVNYEPNSDWNLFATLGWAHTEFTDFVIEETPGTLTDLGGKRFAFSPELTASLGGRYYLTDALYMAATVNFQGKSYGDINNELELDARTLLDLNAGWRITEQWQLDAYVSNVTDEFYLTSNFKGLDENSRLVKAGAPREFGMKVRYTF